MNITIYYLISKINQTCNFVKDNLEDGSFHTKWCKIFEAWT